VDSLVLIVEDDPPTQQLLTTILTRSHLNVLAAHSAEEARKLLEETPPTLILLDLKLPEEQGLSFLSFVRSTYPNIHVIVLTGHPETSLAARAIALGVDEYLYKPFQPQELVTRIQEILNADTRLAHLQQHRSIISMIGGIAYQRDYTANTFTFLDPSLHVLLQHTVTPTSFDESIIQILEKTQTNNQLYQVYKMQTTKGDILYLSDSSTQFQDHGTLICSVGLLQDITEEYTNKLNLANIEAKYQKIIDHSPWGIHLFSLQNQTLILTQANPSASRILQQDHTPLLNLPITEAFPNTPNKIIHDYTLSASEGHSFHYEQTFYSNSLVSGWFEVYAFQIQLGHMIAMFQDVTQRKEQEARLHDLAFKDSLTGLYNRAFFEMSLKRLDSSRQLPLAIVMFDVNGLKLANDAFGHPEGDLLLQRASDSLRTNIRQEDIASRYGGDEFTLILPNTTPTTADQIVTRIQDTCAQSSNSHTLPISLSAGFSVKTTPQQNINTILKQAEDHMYQSKLLETKSVRSQILSSLEHSLKTKSLETEEHALRMSQTAKQFSTLLKLTPHDLTKLELLARLHDIGKLGIPDHILHTTDPLTPDDILTIQKHSEIGYRIAKNIEQLQPIADLILHHHERWDGRGYPLHKQQEDIPLLSRMIALIDAFDVIRYGRHYKPPQTLQETKQEIQRHSGTQFDPNLTTLFLSLEL